MKKIITLISFSTILACLSLAAQESPRPVAGGLDELFKRADRNGDGKLTRDEIPQQFDQLDKNKDGVVTLEEAKADGTPKPETRPPAGPVPKTSPAVGSLDELFKRPDFSGTWVGEQSAGSEAGVVYRVTQDEKGIAFQRGANGPDIRYPLDGSESVTTNGAGRKVRLSGGWLDDGKTLELKTVQLTEDGSAAATILERQSFAADGKTVVLHRAMDGPRGKQEHTYTYRRTDTPAKSAASAAAGSLDELFKRLDRNGDGKLTRDEIPQRFDQIDKNKDGVVTLEEAKADGTPNPEARQPAGPVPKSSSPAFTDLRFTKDYFPGTKDANGKLMGGVECNFIAAHKGRLYATVSTWKQVGYQRGETTGPQVLVKKAHDAPWEVDMTFGPYFGRAECLLPVKFTTDHTGRRLDSPVSLLLATTTGFGSKEIGVWSRDDTTGRWTRMTFGKASSSWGTEIRTLSDHVDRVTGTHSVFAAATEGLIYRGAYDPQTPGGIVWEPQPEYQRPAAMKEQRSPACCEFDGVLYVSLETDPQFPGAGGVFRRVDGPQPRWEHVYEWKHAGAEQEARIGHKFDRNIYGLAGVWDPRDPGRETLICTRNMLAQVLVIDATKTDKATIEFDARRYFEEEFQPDRIKVERIAPNGFTPVTHPDTGEKVHLAGVWITNPAGADPEKGNSSWYLVRHADGTYAHGRVWTPDDPVPNKGVSGGLRSTRSICLSPFPEDKGRVLYFGGFDSGISTSSEEFGYTAWIYKGTLKGKTP